jgi:hypothetical protein
MTRQITITRSDTGESRTLNIRALKRKEIKTLSGLGYSYIGCVPKMETAGEAVDKALEAVLDEQTLAFLDECDNSAVKDTWRAVLKETYGDKDEEKNLSATTSGT